MRADELPEIDWGKSTPTSIHNYYESDGTIIFAVGHRKTNTGKNQTATMYFNGVEWVRISRDTMPNHLQISKPLYNLLEIYTRQEATVILVEDEEIADSVEYFLRQWELTSDFVASTWHGGANSAAYFRPTDLEHRNVILWTSNNQAALAIKSVIFTKVAGVAESFSIIPINPEKYNYKFSPKDICDDGDINWIRNALMNPVLMEKPTIELKLDESGLCDLETPPPDYFIENMKQKHGTVIQGKIFMKPDYFTCMEIAKEDPTFFNAVKYDEAIGQPIWKFSRYPTIDDFKNGILRRFALYGLSPSPTIRSDVFDSIISDGAGRVNTVHRYLDSLVEKHPDLNLTSTVNELFEYIEIPDETDLSIAPSKTRYMEAMDWFFTIAAFHILLAPTQEPVPNEIVPVFVGSQGIGKTRLCRYLAMGQRYYGEITSNVTLGSSDFSRKILGRLIVELGEMNVYKKTDVETVKAVISQAYDEFTPKYKEGVRKFPRVASFIGTSNNAQFLKDKTGNRRFFPIHISKVNNKLYESPEIIEKVWAAYWYKAKSLNEINGMRWMPPATGLVEYYENMTDASIDLGPIEDRLIRSVIRMETLLVSDSRSEFIKITANDIIEDVFGQETKIQWDIKPTMDLVLKRLGYDLRLARVGGRQIKAYVINKADNLLIQRLKENGAPLF